MQAGNVDYGVSKAGVLAFYEGLAQELKFRYQAPKIRTSFVSPSPYFPTLNFQKASSTPATYSPPPSSPIHPNLTIKTNSSHLRKQSQKQW
jgi:NAD(P)-dependent dehydrogenase (short-subunit alcohol dehydrogenase family)